MAISFDSIGRVRVTANVTGAVTVGTPCKFSANDTVAPCAGGDAIHGIITCVKGNLATVAVSGFVTVPYTGTAPTVGYTGLSAAGNGKVKTASGAKERMVVSVDTANATVTFAL